MIRYAITDRSLFPSLEALVTQLRNSTATHIQLREKNLDASHLATFARNIQIACPEKKLLINSRPDISIATNAGVHLTSSPNELTPTQIRTLYKKLNLPSPLISISTHTLEEVRTAQTEQADLILFAPVFEKNGKQGTGLALLSQAAAIAPKKVIALGGVTATNTQACLAAGAIGVAGIRLFLQQ